MVIGTELGSGLKHSQAEPASGIDMEAKGEPPWESCHAFILALRWHGSFWSYVYHLLKGTESQGKSALWSQ